MSKKSQADKSNAINLGLTELLGQKEVQPDNTSSKKRPPQILKKVQSSLGAVDQLQELWNHNQFEKLLLAVEEQENSLESDFTKLNLRTWWVRTQLKLDKMPASLIAASYENFCAEIRDKLSKNINVSEKKLVECAACELANALAQQKQGELSIEYAELAWQLNANNKDKLIKLINQELERTSYQDFKFFEQEWLKSYIARLNNLKAKLKPDWSWKDSVEATVTDKPKIERVNERKSKLASVFFGFLALVVIGFLATTQKPNFALVESFQSLWEPQVIDSITLEVDSLSKVPEVSLPELEKKDVIKVGGLGEILDTLIKAEKENPSLPLSVVPEPQAELTLDKELVKAVVDTSGPIEPEYLSVMANDFDSGKEIKEVPINNESKKTPSIVRGEGRGDYIVEGYERIPGAENTHPLTSSGTRNPGSFYTIMKSAKVFTSPSTRSQELGELKRGQLVEVVGSIGVWRRIRSEKGNEGYILSGALSAL